MPGQPLGGVGCHLYQEFAGYSLTAEKLEQAIAILMQRHPMLHIAFRTDGQQVWLKQPYWNGVTVHDLRQNDAASRQVYLDALRQRLSHRLLRVEIGETFDFQLTLLPDNRHCLHVNIDLLIMDASSFTLFFDELNALLAGESLPAIDPAMISAPICCTSRRCINRCEPKPARTGWRKRLRFLLRRSCRWPATPPRYVKSVIPDAA